ncbi:Cold shock-like protein CspJ [compost metagenome]|jgi:CspA family cold shock protein
MLKVLHLWIINNYKMQEGTVKFFNEEKGFGFITPKNGGSEIFVHVSGLSENIRENDEVRYDVAEGKKGPNAVNVVVA